MEIAKNQFQLQSEIKIVNLQSKNLMRIPAIDIIDGKCSPVKGNNTKIIYNENPLEVAKSLRHTESNICI
jgi:hypothetical protein